jgi:hypothetical protein
MKRKTIDVQYLRDNINQRLADSTCEPEVRYGMISILENVLHETGNYKGFCYLDPITRQATGKMHVLDESRRYYY